MKINMVLATIALAVIVTLPAPAQPQIEPQWLVVPERIDFNEFNSPHRIVRLSDYYYVTAVCGAYFSHGIALRVAKYGSNGQLIGSRFLGMADDGFNLYSMETLSHDKLLITGETVEYNDMTTHAWLDCVDTNLNHVWNLEYEDHSGYWRHYTGATTVVTDSLGTRMVPFVIKKQHLWEDEYNRRIEIYGEYGALLDTLSLYGEYENGTILSMIETPDNEIIMNYEWGEQQIIKHSLSDESVEWSIGTEQAGFQVHEFDVEGFVSIVRDHGTESSTITKYDYSGNHLWDLELDSLSLKSTDVINDELIIFLANTWNYSDQIILGAVDPDGELLWTWQGYEGYFPQDLHVHANGEVVVVGSYTPVYEMNVFLALFQLTQYNRVEFQDPNPKFPAGALSVYPNPSNASTTVQWSLDRPSLVSLTMYDLLGRPARTIFENRGMSPGEHSISIDGEGLASGTYILTLDAGNVGVSSRRITLVK
jgi:Secretion system C-terminal sorting domain